MLRLSSRYAAAAASLSRGRPNLRRSLAGGASPWPPPVRRPSRSSDGYTRFDRRGASSSPLSRSIAYAAAGGLTLYLGYNLERAPFSGRLRLVLVSRTSELQLGGHAFDDLLRDFAPTLLPASHPVTQRVRRVVARLARTANSLDGELTRGFKWAVVVADVPEPNAMCVPGGRILITTGLLDILPSDDDLAVILAHEIAHALNRHGVESMTLQRILWPVVMIVNRIMDTRILPSVFATVFLSLPYSRRLEHEADSVGLLLSTEACYDPRAAPGVFHRLAQLQDAGPAASSAAKSQLGAFLSTHPPTKDRASRLQAQISERMATYNDKCVHSHRFSRPSSSAPRGSFFQS